MVESTQYEISRRSFLKTTLATGAGLLALGAHHDPYSFLTVGICDGGREARLLSAYGYRYIEPSCQGFLVPDKEESQFFDNLKNMQKGGLPTPVANGFLPSRLKVVGPEVDHDAIMNYVAVVFQRANKAGIENIVFGSGGARNVPEGYSMEAATAQFVEVLALMAPVAEENGVVVCLEPLRSQETNFLNTVAETMEVIEKVSHPSIQLTFDTYHVTQEGGGPSDVLVGGKAIKHCHIAEDQDRRAPGVHGEDFVEFFRALNVVGYRGRISVECRWGEREEELPLAVQTLTAQMAKL